MKKISEVQKLEAVDLSDKNTSLSGRVFIEGRLTSLMQLRVLYPSRFPLDNKVCNCNVFVCGVDVRKLDGQLIATTTIGYWGNTLRRLIARIVRNYDDGDLKHAFAVYLTDDTRNFSEYADGEMPIEYMDTETDCKRFLEDMERIEGD